MRVIYLHGFASSASSSKAVFFRTRFAAHGVDVVTPDMNEPDFSTLTITRMLDQVQALIDASPVPIVLIGSSLGAFVAVHAAARDSQSDSPKVSRLVLLAPALDFGGNGLRAPGGGSVEEWQRAGKLDVFHYAYGRVIPVHYELYADATRYDAFAARLEQPILIFQGTRDAAVDPVSVQRWAAPRSNADLRMLDDDHQLHASLEVIWTGTSRFLDLQPA